MGVSFEVKSEQGRARCGVLTTLHGIVRTPAFLNVATQAAIKGALSSKDLEDVGCQIALANTYHLHVRPGDELIRSLGGLHKFMDWEGPILTDSGGFQIFSLAGLRKISEEGVSFQSHVDGRKIFMSPEDSIRIQMNLGTDIAMAFDECIAIPSPHDYVKRSCERTYRWLVRCVKEVKFPCVVFGINQGAVFEDIRVAHMKSIAELDLPGYAIGGLAVGETAEQMYDIIAIVEEHMPKDRPRYLMGVGTPQNIVEAVARGIDMFDCVLPARNGRHGKLYTRDGSINILNEKYSSDESPIDPHCRCFVCSRYSRAYIRHLFKSGEMLAKRLAVVHNLHYYNNLMERIRTAIKNNEYDRFHAGFVG